MSCSLSSARHYLVSGYINCRKPRSTTVKGSNGNITDCFLCALDGQFKLLLHAAVITFAEGIIISSQFVCWFVRFISSDFLKRSISWTVAHIQHLFQILLLIFERSRLKVISATLKIFRWYYISHGSRYLQVLHLVIQQIFGYRKKFWHKLDDLTKLNIVSWWSFAVCECFVVDK